MKALKITYYASTALVSLLMIFSASMYVFQHDTVKGYYEGFGYPTYIIYPYAFLKVAGVIAIWQNKIQWIREWAYAGFFFALFFAIIAHVMIADGEQMAAVLAMVLLLTSYITQKRITSK